MIVSDLKVSSPSAFADGLLFQSPNMVSALIKYAKTLSVLTVPVYDRALNIFPVSSQSMTAAQRMEWP